MPKRDLVCSKTRGVYVRSSIYGAIVGLIKYGGHFYPVYFEKWPDGTWWGKDQNNRWAMVANGRNPYFIENGKPLIPLG